MQQSTGWGAILQIHLSYTTQHRLFFSTQFSLTAARSSDHAAYQRFIKKNPPLEVQQFDIMGSILLRPDLKTLRLLSKQRLYEMNLWEGVGPPDSSTNEVNWPVPPSALCRLFIASLRSAPVWLFIIEREVWTVGHEDDSRYSSA